MAAAHTRLRQESELLSRSSSQHWSQSDLQYASTTNIATDNDAALSLSSTETLKWLGSMSDISLSSSSHATNTSHISASGKSVVVVKLNCCMKFFYKIIKCPLHLHMMGTVMLLALILPMSANYWRTFFLFHSFVAHLYFIIIIILLFCFI